MKLFHLRYLTISILFIVLNSCSTKITDGLISQEISLNEVVNPYFSNRELDYVYKASLDYKNHYFGGLLIIKKLNTNHHRVVFTSEFGNKIFDLEFKEDVGQINFIMDQLNRKNMIKMLVHDLGLLVRENARVINQYVGGEFVYYEANWKGDKNYYVFYDSDKVLNKIVSSNCRKQEVSIEFHVNEVGLAQQIDIIHVDTELKIGLKLL